MGRHWTGPTLSEQSYLFQGNLLLSITAMSQDVCASDWSMILKRSAPSLPYTFSKCPHNLFNLFLSKWQFSDKKVWSFETNVLIDNWFLPTCPGIRRNICLICVRCTLLLSCPGDRFEVSFSSHKIYLCSELPHFDGVTLNNFGCVYLTETHAQWSSCFPIWKTVAMRV